MWLKIFKFLCLFIIFNYSSAYYDKTSYINHHLSRGSRVLTTTAAPKVTEHRLRHMKRSRNDPWGRSVRVEADRKLTHRWTTERPYYRSFTTTTEPSFEEDDAFYNEYGDKDENDGDIDMVSYFMEFIFFL